MKDAAGNWGFHTVKRGPKTSICRFYLRFTDANGHQQRKSLPEGSTFDDAQRERGVQQAALIAALRGIVVPELSSTMAAHQCRRPLTSTK